ncbi:MAG: hypothetical protein WC809_00995 [Sinimarinibacterium sp.]|jgi:hypothetical protein
MRVPSRAKRTAAAGLVLAGAPLPAAAHSFGTLYTLPVPVWMYLYGAAAALAVSFLMIGYFVSTPAQAHRNYRTSGWKMLHTPVLLGDLRLLSVALLLLSMVSGLVGSSNSYSNFNMTFFWIVILLGYTYWTALFGNSYDALNPWRAIIGAIARYSPQAFAGRRSYPAKLAFHPALLLYMALVWMELFGKMQPLSLSLMLITYTVITLVGAWWWGSQAWFEYCDVFGVFFRVIGKIAPLEWSAKGLRIRQPFIGLLDQPCGHTSLLLFILFMLSSTAFDGVHETELWVGLSHDVMNLGRAVLGTQSDTTTPSLILLHAGFQSLSLLASPLLYLCVYVALLWLAKQLTRSQIPLRRLCLEFGYSLVPIAFVYNLSHYYTLALSQGPRIFRLASDPLGYGWNLFGTRGWFSSTILLDAGTVWHTQVWLILAGHIVSVYLSHLVALRLFPGGRAAVISQFPLLILMVLYTTAGLWILSLPIQVGV